MDLIRILLNMVVSTQNSEEVIYLSKDQFILNFLREMMHVKGVKAFSETVKVLGTFFVYNEELPSLFIKLGLISIIKEQMNYASNALKKDLIWLVSNIIVNSEADAMECLDPGLIFNIFQTCSTNSNMAMRREALWCISNLSQAINS
jgi:hypothetical protein